MSTISPDNRAEIDGIRVVNRAGLAELTGLSRSRIMVLASPGRRASSGCPIPVDRRTPPGRTGAPEWWYPEDLARAWAASLRAPRKQLGEPEDPDELITAAQYRKLLGIERSTWNAYVRDSLDAWSRGHASKTLALPVNPEPAQRGRPEHDQARHWRRGDVVAHYNRRPGPVRGGRPATADRVPQPTPQPDDPDELISETTLRTKIMNPPVSARHLNKLIARSEPAWRQGDDGPLPRPDDSTPHYTGRTLYRWRAGRAAQWWNTLADLDQGTQERP